MSPGQAKMDIGNLEHTPAAPVPEKAQDAPLETPNKEWPMTPTYEEYLGYIGKGGKGDPNKGKGKGIKGNCWKCNKPGHRAVDCKGKGKGKGKDWYGGNKGSGD
eukprot:7945343-Karenia_brevis.AAC.1